MVLLHGGSWAWPYNRWVMWLLARDGNRRGWNIANMDYRRLGRFGGGGGWPQTFDDARAAVDLITNDAADLGIDTDKVIVVGHSAGGHLGIVGAATARRQPALVVSMSGPTNLERLWTNGSAPVRDLVAGAPELDRWQSISPVHMVPIGVPTICVHGDADTTVEPRHSTEFVQVARAAGDTADLVLVAGESHVDALKPNSGIWSAVVATIEARFRRASCT